MTKSIVCGGLISFPSSIPLALLAVADSDGVGVSVSAIVCPKHQSSY
jgi:hypothetical protein